MFRTIPVIALALVASSAAFAGVPDVVTYAGTLKQGTAPADGTFSAVFELFDAASEGSRVFSQAEASLAVTGGDLVVDLGSDASNPLTDDVLASGQLFLQITVNGESLSPRVPFTSVPFARRAKVAEEASTLAGLTPDDVANLVQAGPGLAAAGHVFSLADQGVTNAKIQDGAVDATKLADGSVSSTKIQPGAVGTNSILDGSVTQSKFASSVVWQTANIASRAITNSLIGDAAVTGNKIAPNNIGAPQLADNGIPTSKLVDHAVTAAKAKTLAVFQQPLGCGAGLALGTEGLCRTIACSASAFLTCTGSCSATAPQTCTVNQAAPIGFLLLN